MNQSEEIVFNNLIDPSTGKPIRMVIDNPSPEYLNHLKAMGLAGFEHGQHLRALLMSDQEDT